MELVLGLGSQLVEGGDAAGTGADGQSQVIGALPRAGRASAGRSRPRILSSLGETDGEPIYGQACGLRVGRLPRSSSSIPFIADPWFSLYPILGSPLETEHTRVGCAHQHGTSQPCSPEEGIAQNVGDPRPAGTAVFQTAYGPHDQLSATLRANALRAAPDNAGQPAGLIPAVYANGDTGLIRSAARSFRVPTQRVGTRKGWPIPKPCRRDACATSGATFYDTLPPRVSQKPLSLRKGVAKVPLPPGEGLGRGDQKIST